MAKLSKKQLKDINRISCYYDIIKEQGGRIIGESDWVDTHPDMWSKQEIELFTILTDLEERVKSEVLKIVSE